MSSKRQTLKVLAQELKAKKYCPKKLKQVLKKITDQAIDLQTKIYRGKTLLHYGVKANEKGYVKLLIKSGVNPNICDDDYNTPLHYAIIHNCYQAAVELIKGGADLDYTGEFEQTPLHIASIYGRVDFVKLLVKNHADVRLVDERNLTALDYALDEKNEAIINYLKNILTR